MLGFVLGPVVLQLLRAPVAAVAGLQRLLEQLLCFGDGGRLLFRQEDVSRGAPVHADNSRHQSQRQDGRHGCGRACRRARG